MTTEISQDKRERIYVANSQLDLPNLASLRMKQQSRASSCFSGVPLLHCPRCELHDAPRCHRWSVLRRNDSPRTGAHSTQRESPQRNRTLSPTHGTIQARISSAQPFVQTHTSTGPELAMRWSNSNTNAGSLSSGEMERFMSLRGPPGPIFATMPPTALRVFVVLAMQTSPLAS